MFTSFHELTIDSKNRLSVPASIRAELEAEAEGRPVRLYLVPGEWKRTLTLVSEKRFQSFVRPLREVPSGDNAARGRSLFFAAASPLLEMDAQGRVLLPSQHLLLGGIERQIVLIGYFDRCLIMNREEGLNFLKAFWESRQKELPSVVAEDPSVAGKFWEGFGQEQRDPDGDGPVRS